MYFTTIYCNPAANKRRTLMNRRVLTHEIWKMKDEIERRKKFRKIQLKRIFVSADVKHTRRKFCT
jgi:hypothetical protein